MTPRLRFRSARPRTLALVGAGALLLCARGAASQASGLPAAGPADCPEGRISQLFIDNHSVFDRSDPTLNARLDWAYDLANGVHVPTRERVIRREILVEEGDCYDVARLRESERLLRALGFIAEVDVFGVRQPDSTIHVIIDTRDEWSLRAEPRVGDGGRAALTGIRLREDNLLGTGMHVSGFYFDRPEESVYGAAFRTPQLFQTRWDASLEGGKTPAGYLFSQALTYPFVGDTGRWAFRQAIYRNDRNFVLRVPEGDGVASVWLPESRISVDVGGMYRWGRERYRRTVVGAGVRGEWVSYPDRPEYANRDLRGRAPPVELGSQLDSISSIRATFVVGQRNVYYVRRRALETLRATEDLRLGVESQMVIAPSLPGISGERDLRLGYEFFTAGEVPAVGVLGGNFVVEARRNYDTDANHPEWSDVLGHLGVWSYLRADPDGRDMVVASVSAAGGWNVRVPFQLTLGSEAGVRGYPSYRDPGARRVVASVEHRHYLGWPLPDLFDLGSVLFADVGKMWAGDVPFGVSSPVRAGVGVGLRAAFPPGSRRTLRIDLGAPVARGMRLNDLVLTIGIGQWIGRGPSKRDRQLDRSAHLWTRQSLLSLPSD